MVILISGATHTGKTLLAQALLEERQMPLLSLDLLKMGLIRSGLCPLSPEAPDAELTAFLWPIAREMVRTALENHQDLIVEGAYIPADALGDFPPPREGPLHHICLVLGESYIRREYPAIVKHSRAIERRRHDVPAMDHLIAENVRILAEAKAAGTPLLLVEKDYDITPGRLPF